MLFYVSLILFSIAVSAIVLWFYRSLFEIGKATYQAIFPSAKKQYREERLESLNPSLNSAATPWGWSGGGSRRAIPVAPTVTRKAATAPWGWKGGGDSAKSRNTATNANAQQANSKGTSDIGWPYREEKFDFSGKEYTVVKKKRVKKSNMSGVSKPWGW
jgi:hypothetical protein